MDKLKYKMIPEGTLNDQIIPLNLIFVDARDVKAAGLSFREAFERIAKTIKEPSMMNIIDLDCVTTTSDGLMVEGAIVAMAASDRNRIHPEFGFLEMLDVTYSKELIAEEPHLRQWDILYPGRHLVMGPKAKLLPIHNAAMTGRACNNNGGTEVWSIATMEELLLPILGQIEIVRGGKVIVGKTGEVISVSIGMVVGEEYGRIMPHRAFHVGQTAHRSGEKAKGLKAHIPVITCDKKVLARYIIQALDAGMVPGRDIGPAPSILVIARLLGKEIDMEHIEEAAFEELASVGFTKEWITAPAERMQPEEIISQYGADILRLWAASADYHADVRCSKEIFKQLSQNYLKFRNTCKFMLDNLVDFDPEKLTKPEDMPVLDRWLLTKLNELIEKAEQSYCDYEFHIITHAVNDFCVTTLSSFYLDIVKDCLYCDGADSLSRRSAQTALYLTLHTLAKLFAPILAFTCDEIWLAMPHTGDDDARNVVLNEMNKPFTAYALDSETMARWEHIIAVRTVVNGALEEARAAKVIGKSLEADVHLTVPESDRFFADESPEALADIFIVSKVELAIGDALAVKVDNAAGTKCPRCWKHSLEANAEGLCPRCAEVVKHLHLTELL